MGKYLKSHDAADLLGISTSKLYKLTMTRQIPHKKIFGRLRFETEKLMQWLEEQSVIISTDEELMKKAEAHSKTGRNSG